MKGTATVTTKTTVTPVTVTEIKNGTVAMQTGMSIIVRTEEGIKSFTQSDVDKRGVKIMRSGKPAQISDFREGDRLSATIITSKPPTVLTEKEVQATLASAGKAGGAGGAGGSTAAKSAGTPGAAASAAWRRERRRGCGWRRSQDAAKDGQPPTAGRIRRSRLAPDRNRIGRAAPVRQLID